MVRKMILFSIITAMLAGGCGSSRQLVTFNDVEATNTVEILLTTGDKVTGSVVRTQPLELIVLNKDRQEVKIPKSTIREIKRETPIRDDFGKGISEAEIASKKSGKNALVYGIGGGALSAAASLFAGSMISKDQDEGAGVLAGTTLGGTAVGTYFFVKAGQRKDREEAIEAIRKERRKKGVEIRQDENKEEADNLMRQLEQEKEEQEKLRKEREALLKKLRTE